MSLRYFCDTDGGDKQPTRAFASIRGHSYTALSRQPSARVVLFVAR